jgi:hypothetical protein
MLTRVLLLSFLFCIYSCHHADSGEKTGKSLNTAPLLSYQQEKHFIDSNRKVFQKIYLDDTTKEVAFSSAKRFLLQTIGTDLYQYWKGTPWDFNGTTTTPQRGTIACGYFVNSVLQDAGVKLNRTKLSVCPSLTMMKELTSIQSIKNLSALSYDGFEQWIRQNGEGVYITGLDFHTGFIINDGNEIWFLHSNYIGKQGVIKEKIKTSQALKASKTRYITCLTESKKFLMGWLLH